MKTIILSDHPAEQLALREARRAEAFEKDMQSYRRTSENRDADFSAKSKKYERLMSEKKTSLYKGVRDRKPVQCAISLLALAHGRLFHFPRHATPAPVMPIKVGEDDQDRIWRTGQEGESALDAHLARFLDDGWVCLCGFHNRGGEIDRLLVGKDGIFAIEVKNMSGRVSCNGDSWSRDKYDAYGNLVDRNLPIKDKGGRSPSRQVNEPVALLESRLRQDFPDIKAVRAVVFTNVRSEIGQIVAPTVDEVLLLRSWDVATTLRRSDAGLQDKDIQRIVDVIGSEHEENRRQNRKSRNRHSNGCQNRNCCQKPALATA